MASSDIFSPAKTLVFLKELRNVTKEAGDFLRLRCEVAGSPPASSFEWLKNGVPIMEEKNRVKVRTKVKENPQWSQLRGGSYEITSIYTVFRLNPFYI